MMEQSTMETERWKPEMKWFDLSLSLSLSLWLSFSSAELVLLSFNVMQMLFSFSYSLSLSLSLFSRISFIIVIQYYANAVCLFVFFLFF